MYAWAVLLLHNRDPLLAFLTISLAVTSAAAIYDIHSTLEFVGVYAIIATAGLIPVNYDSLEVCCCTSLH